MAKPKAPPSNQSGQPSARPSEVTVIELDDVVARRVLDRPNLLVDYAVNAAAKLAALRAGRGTPRWARGHAVRLRPDLLVPNETKPDTLTRLAAAGFTVNRTQTLWRVYVIELGPSPEDCAGWVYVGETGNDIDQRVEQHRTAARLASGKGKLNSPVVTKHFVRRRIDLEPPQPLFSREQSLRLESEWAEHLRGQGYKVEGGH
jgi:hypothetical protein